MAIESQRNVALPLDTKEVADTKTRSQFAEFWLRYRRHGMAVFGTFLFGFLLFVAIIMPFFVPEPGVNTATMNQMKNNPPSTTNIFGTTNIGLDVFGLVVHGARISLFLSMFAMLVTCGVGTLIGIISGYYGGWIDAVLMRIVDIFLCVPLLFVLLLTSRFLVKPPGQTTTSAVDNPELRSLVLLPIIIGLLSWPSVARLVRSVTLSVKEQEFVTGARAVGARNSRIMFSHILPNVINPVVVAATLLVGQFIVLESFLSYLGYGIQFPLRSWGTSLANSQTEFASGNWWWAFFPGLFILLTVLAINFIGDGLRDALDPRSKR
jgi:peptide/nickel transport system permease protein